VSSRTARWLAWSLWVLSIALATAGLFFLGLNYRDLRGIMSTAFTGNGIIALVYPTVGALLVSRRPDNRIGWLFCAQGPIHGMAVFAGQYGRYALVTQPDSLPGGVWMAWLGSWAWAPGFGTLAMFLPLLFPDGRLISPRWRPVAWIAAFLVALGTVSFALRPPGSVGPSSISSAITIQGVEPVLRVLPGIVVLMVVPAWLACVASLILRFRRSQGQERLQLKWFTYAVAMYFVAIVGSAVLLPEYAAGFQILSAPIMPAFLGIAILKYRLYDIDIIIRRTLVYGVLTATLAFVYFGSVVLLQQLSRALTGQQQSEFVTVISTLAIAALFNPLRQRVQAFIDKRFYRRKYDAQQVLASFSASVRDEVALHQLSEHLRDVVEETMQPTQVSLWLRAPAREVKR